MQQGQDFKMSMTANNAKKKLKILQKFCPNRSVSCFYIYVKLVIFMILSYIFLKYNTYILYKYVLF